MGMDKSQLVFKGMTFLEQVVFRSSQVCDPIVLVGDIDFSNHDLPDGVLFDQDQEPNKGPLEGMRVGLKRLSSLVEFAFVTSCDAPLVKPELIRYLFGEVGQSNAVVPQEGERVFGMASIYRTALYSTIGERVAANQLRVSKLAREINANHPDMDSIRLIDPHLDSLTNINSKADYQRLIKRFNLRCPATICDALGLDPDSFDDRD